MPTYQKHMEQAEHNGELLEFIGRDGAQTRFSDWYVTVVFYTALHYFEAMLFKVKPSVQFGTLSATVEHSGSLSTFYVKHSEHQIRKKLMRTNFPQIYNPYRTLYEMSRTARYDCHTPSTHNWADAEAYLDDVKRECETLVGNKK